MWPTVFGVLPVDVSCLSSAELQLRHERNVIERLAFFTSMSVATVVFILLDAIFFFCFGKHGVK